MLQSADTPLIVPYMYELSVQGNFTRLAAIGVAITLFLIVATVVIHRIGPTNSIGKL